MSHQLDRETLARIFEEAGRLFQGGPDWLVAEFEQRWHDERQREILLQVIRWMEREPVALGTSPHIVAVARKCE